MNPRPLELQSSTLTTAPAGPEGISLIMSLKKVSELKRVLPLVRAFLLSPGGIVVRVINSTLKGDAALSNYLRGEEPWPSG